MEFVLYKKRELWKKRRNENNEKGSILYSYFLHAVKTVRVGLRNQDIDEGESVEDKNHSLYEEL